jgi:hypothetical protein
LALTHFSHTHLCHNSATQSSWIEKKRPATDSNCIVLFVRKSMCHMKDSLPRAPLLFPTVCLRVRTTLERLRPKMTKGTPRLSLTNPPTTHRPEKTCRGSRQSTSQSRVPRIDSRARRRRLRFRKRRYGGLMQKIKHRQPRPLRKRTLRRMLSSKARYQILPRPPLGTSTSG